MLSCAVVRVGRLIGWLQLLGVQPVVFSHSNRKVCETRERHCAASAVGVEADAAVPTSQHQSHFVSFKAATLLDPSRHRVCRLVRRDVRGAHHGA